jgi:CheY-like chemotaxis protein
MAYRIQIVEDERIVALDLKIALQSLGFDVVASCASGEAIAAPAAQARPHPDGHSSGRRACREPKPHSSSARHWIFR